MNQFVQQPAGDGLLFNWSFTLLLTGGSCTSQQSVSQITRFSDTIQLNRTEKPPFGGSEREPSSCLQTRCQGVVARSKEGTAWPS